MTVPPEAITAAVKANDRFFGTDEDLKHNWQDGSDVAELAKWMLEAAAPLIAAAERGRIRELILHERDAIRYDDELAWAAKGALQRAADLLRSDPS